MASSSPTLDLRCPGQWFVFGSALGPWSLRACLLAAVGGQSQDGGSLGLNVPTGPGGSELGLRPEWESEALFAVK